MIHHRYGELVVITENGRWYWDKILMVIAFVQKGKQVASIERNVNTKQNTIAGVLSKIARVEKYKPLNM